HAQEEHNSCLTSSSLELVDREQRKDADPVFGSVNQRSTSQCQPITTSRNFAWLLQDGHPAWDWPSFAAWSHVALASPLSPVLPGRSSRSPMRRALTGSWVTSGARRTLIRSHYKF